MKLDSDYVNFAVVVCTACLSVDAHSADLGAPAWIRFVASRRRSHTHIS
jgi:hypothetical protein